MGGPVFTCRVSDLRRIKISCRCGVSSIAEIPQQIAAGYVLHPCPGCGTFFSVHQTPEEKWEVKRTGDKVSDTSFIRPDVPEPVTVQERDDPPYGVGMRVRITDHSGIPGVSLVSPHPEYVGKLGTITKIVLVEGYKSPLITLDDGKTVGGWECWWEPYTIGKGN